MVGTVVRRFLISYPVDPESLTDHLPPGAQLSLFDGKAWISACFVRMDDMRPSMAPRILGSGFYYLIHRTRARLPFPDGQLREAVLVLQPNINRRLLAMGGSVLTGVKFSVRNIQFQTTDDSWRITMFDGRESLFDATLEQSTDGPNDALSNSRFDSVQQADDFLLGVSFGGQWKRGSKSFGLLPETHDAWQTSAVRCKTHKNAFLESLTSSVEEADHAITMSDCPHYFGIRPITTRLGA